MKRLFAILLVAVIAAAACACGDNDVNNTKDVSQSTQNNDKAENVTDKGQTKEDIDALAEAAIKKMSVVPEYPEGYPTLEDVVSQYRKAEMVVGWIVNTTAVATDDEDTIERYNMIYRRVLPDCHYGVEYLSDKSASKETDKLIYNKETLEAYLATLIVPIEAYDYVLDIDAYDIPRFVEGENGALYALGFSMPARGYGADDRFELTKNDDGSYTFTVYYTVLNDDGSTRAEHSRDFEYINLDGRWVFRNFHMIKQH